MDVLSRYPVEVLEQAVDLGLHRIFVGLESGSPRILKKMNKRIDTDQMLMFAEKTKNLGFEIYLGMILGIPGETVEDLIISGRLIQKLEEIKPDLAYRVVKFTPYPGLPLTQELELMGAKLPQNLAEWGAIERYNSNIDVPFWIEDKDEYWRQYLTYFGNPRPVTYKAADDKLQTQRVSHFTDIAVEAI